MYVLHHHPLSQHARRVVALLEAAHLPYELRRVSLETGEHLSDGYRAINPNHQVPTLVDGELKIFESNAILRHLCHKHGLVDWHPDDPARRAMVEQWLDWNQCRLSPAVVDIVFNAVFLGPKGDQAAIARGRDRLAELAPILETALQSQPYLAGATPTIADLSVASNIAQLALADAAPSTPSIRAWYGRIDALDGVQRSNAGLKAMAPA